ncbi:helix-turn-helix domain-containing protein [Enterococcus sp. LJL98]
MERSVVLLGLPKEGLLKKELVLFLDQQRQERTTEELTAQFAPLTGQTILKHLKELDEMIQTLYAPEQLTLSIQPRIGIRLYREKVNLNRLYEAIDCRSLTYAIYRDLFLHRAFLTDDFCEKMQVSFSTIRRLIKTINQEIQIYDVFIKVGKRVRITGDESQIRLLFFLFFYGVHRELSAIPWMEKEEAFAVANQVCEVFYEQPSQLKVDVLALWLAIHQQANRQGEKMTQNPFSEKYPESILLNRTLSESTWNYLLLVMDALDLIPFEPRLTFESLYQNPFSQAVKSWLGLFERQIQRVSKQEKKDFYRQMYRLSVLNQLTRNQKDIDVIFRHLPERGPDSFPYFQMKFDQTWQQFQSEQPEKSQQIDREFLRNWSYQVARDETLLPTIPCYWHSSLTNQTQKKLAKELQWRLKNEVNFCFTSDAQQAVLQLSTESQAKGLPIATPLSEHDVEQVRQAVYDLIKNGSV